MTNHRSYAQPDTTSDTFLFHIKFASLKFSQFKAITCCIALFNL